MDTIKKNSDFKYVYDTGNSIADSNLVLYYKKKDNVPSRFGISISKKVGGSVLRNRIKRQIKEILRINDDSISEGYDIIFIVRVRCNRADFRKIKESVYHLLRKAKLLSNKDQFS